MTHARYSACATVRCAARVALSRSCNPRESLRHRRLRLAAATESRMRRLQCIHTAGRDNGRHHVAMRAQIAQRQAAAEGSRIASAAPFAVGHERLHDDVDTAAVGNGARVTVGAAE